MNNWVLVVGDGCRRLHAEQGRICTAAPVPLALLRRAMTYIPFRASITSLLATWTVSLNSYFMRTVPLPIILRRFEFRGFLIHVGFNLYQTQLPLSITGFETLP